MNSTRNMIDTTPIDQDERDYQAVCNRKRRRISKVSMSLGDAVAERLRNELYRKNSIVAVEPETEPEEPVAVPIAETTESAAFRVLHNFDLFESILMELPWSGTPAETQCQTIRTIMTASRTCRSFKSMVDNSARLQKRLFLSRDSESRKPCYCGHDEEERICSTETNPFIAPLLKKHILHNAFSCDHRRQKQVGVQLARAQQKSLRRRQSRAGLLPENFQEQPIVFRDVQDKQRKHMLAFQVSENDPFYLLGERTKPDASWRNMYLTNPAPTRVEIYYWSYLIRCVSKDGEPLTAGTVWDTVHEALEVARQRKAPGYQYEADEPLLVLVGSWEKDEEKHVYDWLNQRHEACKSPVCRYLKS